MKPLTETLRNLSEKSKKRKLEAGKIASGIKGLAEAAKKATEEEESEEE